jgi:hypothetical protein
MNFKEKMASRKFFIAAGILGSATALLALPALLNFYIDSNVMFLTGAEWVSCVITTYTIYAGANFAEKRWVTGSETSTKAKKEDDV